MYSAISASKASHSVPRIYDPEFRARNAASRTSSLIKTRDSGMFLISIVERWLESLRTVAGEVISFPYSRVESTTAIHSGDLLGNVDPGSSLRRFQRGFHHSHG